MSIALKTLKDEAVQRGLGHSMVEGDYNQGVIWVGECRVLARANRRSIDLLTVAEGRSESGVRLAQESFLREVNEEPTSGGA